MFNQLKFDNQYARLPAEFYHKVSPEPLEGTAFASLNSDVQSLLSFTQAEFNAQQFIRYVTGIDAWSGSEPLAMCYAGHQFGTYVPRLGDGRAVLLGQIRDKQQQLWDLQIKGSGITRYSRQGDGRAVLRSCIREYLCSEAMHGLGIPTTRALALISSKQMVYRETFEPGAMMLRVAQSHVRFGSLEYFYYAQKFDYLQLLADYVIREHYPDLEGQADAYQKLFAVVLKKTAKLIAQWQSVGFAHGVLNTDNMSIIGLTLDYGPFAFLDTYEANYICNHSDTSGRYAFSQQPQIGLFNLSCLAQAMLPLFDDDPERAAEFAKAELSHYQALYQTAYLNISRDKLGLFEQEKGDSELMESLLALMEGQVDYTLFFRQLSALHAEQESSQNALAEQFSNSRGMSDWLARYRVRLFQEKSRDTDRHVRMKKVNAKYILRNHMAESAIKLAENENDFSEVERLLTLLRRPFDEQPSYAHYAQKPPAWAGEICISCSS